MMLLNPKKYVREHADARSRQFVEKTIAFFEKKGLRRIKEDDQSMVWYEDFLAFIKDERIFADLLTPAAYARSQSGRRWDMWRISEFNEVLAFYGLCYWYAWQVTILGLGPIWMGDNEEVKNKTAELLAAGQLFTLIVYAQLILENVKIDEIDSDLLEQIFAFLIRDFSAFALQMVLSYENTPEQESLYSTMIKKPGKDTGGFVRVWSQQVFSLKDQYRMND